MLSRSFAVRRESGSIVHRHHRAGMTLVELLTALGITILLAAIAVPAVLSVIRGDRLRDASSSVQGFITAARERAALDNRPRGVRLVPDPDNPELVRQLIMIREADPIAPGGSLYGGAIVSNYLSASLGMAARFNDTVEIPFDQQFVNTLVQSQPLGQVLLSRYNATTPYTVVRGILRIGSSGPFRAFSYFLNDPLLNRKTTDLATGLNLAQPRTLLILDEPLPTPIGMDIDGPNFLLPASGIGIEISRPPVPLEGVEPLVLPQGIVIDLGQLPKPANPGAISPTNTVTLSVDPSNQRLTRLTPRMPNITLYSPGTPVDYSFDILFSPQRSVIGPAAVDERIILWLRDEAGVLAESNPSYQTQASSSAQAAVFRKQLNITSSTSNSLVALMTRTGIMGTFKPVLTDELSEAGNGNNGGADGFYDFARYYDNVNANVGVND